MAYLAPSLLSADFSKLSDEIEKTREGGADYIHMDIMDGRFVPNITFGGPVVKSLVGKTPLPFDIHLMTEHPEERIRDFVTPQTEFIVVHQEACVHLHRTVCMIKELGIKAGVALNPATPVSLLECIAEYVDMVLVMSVNPGFGGQKFIPSSFEKVRKLVNLRAEKGLRFLIELDGGVNLENAKKLKEAGVDVFVAGSSVYGAGDIAARCREFKKILE